jgi:hypothetical protein
MAASADRHDGRPTRRSGQGRTSPEAAWLLVLVLLLALQGQSALAQSTPAPAARPAATPAARASTPARPGTAPPAAKPAPATPAATLPASGASTPAGQARVPNPIDGALGIRFDTALPRHVRGGTLPGQPLPLPSGVGASAVETRPGVQQLWTPVQPPTLPQLLVTARPPPAHAVLLDDARVPVRILTEVRTPNCQSLFVALGKRLAERYGAAADVPRPPGVEHYSLFESAKRFVQVGCSGERLRLDYIDTRGVLRWQAEHQARIAAHDRRQRLALAARVAPSRGDQMGSAFGIEFGRPCALQGVLPDIDADVLPPAPFAAWPGARYELMVDPDGYPIRISAVAQFVDAAAAAAERQRVVAALVERYGAPRRNKPLHAVITRGGRHAVVIQEGSQLSLVFMDGERLQSQRARLQRRQSELAEAADRQRAAERAGL